MVSILLEKYRYKQSRYYFSGSSLDMDWELQTRVVIVETTRYKGTKTEVEDLLDEMGEDNSAMRKSDGPWWETDITETTSTAWTTVDSSDDEES